jgi:hypothetical protein
MNYRDYLKFLTIFGFVIISIGSGKQNVRTIEPVQKEENVKEKKLVTIPSYATQAQINSFNNGECKLLLDEGFWPGSRLCNICKVDGTFGTIMRQPDCNDSGYKFEKFNQQEIDKANKAKSEYSKSAADLIRSLGIAKTCQQIRNAEVQCAPANNYNQCMKILLRGDNYKQYNSVCK